MDPPPFGFGLISDIWWSFSGSHVSSNVSVSLVSEEPNLQILLSDEIISRFSFPVDAEGFYLPDVCLVRQNPSFNILF